MWKADDGGNRLSVSFPSLMATGDSDEPLKNEVVVLYKRCKSGVVTAKVRLAVRQVEMIGCLLDASVNKRMVGAKVVTKRLCRVVLSAGLIRTTRAQARPKGAETGEMERL
jgi:hypothetical protein